MRSLFFIAALAACREPGTMNVHLVKPCAADPETAAVYLVRGTCDAPLACGLPAFRCDDGCVDVCGGYCGVDELADLSVTPADAKTRWALIISYRYPGATNDEGLLCYELPVMPDEEGMTEVELTNVDTCCMGSGA